MASGVLNNSSGDRAHARCSARFGAGCSSSRSMVYSSLVRAGGKASDASVDAEARTYLEKLVITDFALVREQTVEFHPGLNVITRQV